MEKDAKEHRVESQNASQLYYIGGGGGGGGVAFVKLICICFCYETKPQMAYNSLLRRLCNNV